MAQPSTESPAQANDSSAAPSKGRRWLRRGLLALVAVPLLWLLTINLVLWTGLAGRIVTGARAWSTLKVEHGWAWCVWPTVVHVHDLHIVIDAPRLQLEVELPHVVADVEVRELLERRLRTKRVAAVDASVYVSIKKPHGTDLEAVSAFRRMEGLDAPIRDATPRPRPTQEEAWELDLRGVTSSLSRVQINAASLELQGRVRGSLLLKVAHRLEVPEVELTIASAALSRDGHGLAREIGGAVQAQVDAFDPVESSGREILRFVSAELDFDGRTADLAWLDELPRGPELSFSQGEGAVSAKVEASKGRLLPGSELHYEAETVSLRKGFDAQSFEARAALTVDLEVVEGQRAPGRGEVRLRRLESFDDTETDAPWFTAPKLSASLSASDVDLVEGPGVLRLASLELPELAVTRLSAVAPLVDGVTIRGGALSGRASAQGSNLLEALDFDFALDANGLSLRKGETALQSDGYLRAKGTVDLDARRVVFDPLHAKLQGLALATSRGETADNWVEIAGGRAELELESKSLKLEAKGRIDSLRTLLAHLRPGEDAYERVPEMGFGSGEVEYELRVRASPGRMRVEVEELFSGAVDLVLALSRVGEEMRLAAHLRRAKLGLVSSGGEQRSWKPAVGRDWFESKRVWVFAQLEG